MTKTSDKKGTFLNVLAEALNAKYPHLIDLRSDLPSIPQAAKGNWYFINYFFIPLFSYFLYIEFTILHFTANDTNKNTITSVPWSKGSF